MVFFLSLFFLSLGSFASVLIYRLPLAGIENSNINLFLPRSHCPTCKENIRLINLLPLIGYIFQAGKCEKCKSAISINYFIHEIIHLTIGLSLYFLLGISFLSILVYLLFFNFYILLVCDLNKFFLPFYFNLSISLIGIGSIFLGSPFFIETYGLIESSQLFIAFFGFVSGYGILFLINLIYKIINKIDGIGGGDFVLLGGIGTLVGPLHLSSIILLGSFSTLIIKFTNYKKYKQELPLGAGLIIGLFVYTICKFFELSLFGLVI